MEEEVYCRQKEEYKQGQRRLGESFVNLARLSWVMYRERERSTGEEPLTKRGKTSQPAHT